MSRDERDLHHLFRRDIDRVQLPPASVWVPGAKRLSGPRWRPLLAIPAAAGVIALALVVAFLINLARTPQVATSPSPSASIAPSVGVSASPSAPPPVSPSASPSPDAVEHPRSDGVRIWNKLPATGTFAILMKRGHDRVPDAQGQLVASGTALASISAVPLSAPTRQGHETVLLDFISATPWNATDNVLREQFSPDGQRLVLSVLDGESRDARLTLVVVDLIAGTVRALATDQASHDVQPAWRPNGEEIAFVRRARAQAAGNSDLGIWSIRSDGTGLRRILPGSPNPPESTGLFAWNGDGTWVGFARGFEGARYQVVEATLTGHVNTIGDLWAQDRAMADWRSGSPAFVGAFMEGPRGGRQYLVTADQDGRNARTIVRGDAVDGNTFFAAARWRPGSNDILFMRTSADAGAKTIIATILLTDAGGRAPTEVATTKAPIGPAGIAARTHAAWTPDGREVVYVYGLGAGGELHLIASDGSNDRVIQAFGGVPEADLQWIDLAVLSF